ncbi:hypothetical protein G3M74_16665 [Paenibacillus polymyxa]|nr:hypothetical protein [Paenibacillus polymyxa]
MTTIVPANKIKHDPQELLYHFPSIQPVRYTKLSQEYYFWSQVKTAEQIAGMFGRLLVPASCLHWQRKTRHAERRVHIGKSCYYALAEKELTKMEHEKYMSMVVVAGEDEAV